MSTEDISKFLEMFAPIYLHYREPEYYSNAWVFWSENEGSENNSSTTTTHLDTLKIHDKIISVFSVIRAGYCFGQLWVPVTIGGRQLLSTSGQPFAGWPLLEMLAKYRLDSEKFRYNIDMNYMLDNEGDHMIISGGPAIAFLNRLPYIYPPVVPEDCGVRILDCSVMLPICFPSHSQSSCIGVIELTFYRGLYSVGALILLDMIKAVKKAGLDVFHVQDFIPYATINGLKLAKTEIKEALKVVCESHNLDLAQAWIAFDDKNYVSEDTQTNRFLAIKLTGYLNQESQDEEFEQYFRACDVLPCTIWSGAPAEVELPLQTLQDYGSHYIHALHHSMLISWKARLSKTSALAICLRSNDTGDFNYALEFIWPAQSKYVVLNHLEDIILTLKGCLPKFKFASGAELGDELEVIVADQTATQSENDNIVESEIFKIFKGKTSSQMPKAPEEGNNYIEPSMVACKTTAKVLPREVIEKQFGKTMKEAAKNLNVSLSTFKRKFKELGIPEWPGPIFLKKKANDSSIVQVDTNEEDNGAILEPSIIIIDQNTLTIKAELSDDMIKFDLPISQATFITIEKEIGMKWELSVGTYKLKYLDEEGDWILLRSDAKMLDCIKSLRKSNRTTVKIRVLPSPQPISGPSGSFSLWSMLGIPECSRLSWRARQV